MSQLTHVPNKTTLQSSDLRQVGRALSRQQAGLTIRRGAIDTATELALDKVDSATAVTGQAMGAVVRVAQVQQPLEVLAPSTSGRLNLLADDHALGMVELTAEHRRNLRRL